jgi:hypothetical protein
MHITHICMLKPVTIGKDAEGKDIHCGDELIVLTASHGLVEGDVVTASGWNNASGEIIVSTGTRRGAMIYPKHLRAA